MESLPPSLDRGDVHVAVQHFDVRIGFDLSAEHVAGLVDAQANGLARLRPSS